LIQTEKTSAIAFLAMFEGYYLFTISVTDFHDPISNLKIIFRVCRFGEGLNRYRKNWKKLG